MGVLGLHCLSRTFSSCVEWGATVHCGVKVSHCGGFSCCGAQALEHMGSVSVMHGLSCPAACGILKRPGIQLMSSALAGGFSTAGPLGKSLNSVLISFIYM